MTINSEPVIYIEKSECATVPEGTYMPLHIADRIIKNSSLGYEIGINVAAMIKNKLVVADGKIQTGGSLGGCINLTDNDDFDRSYIERHLNNGGLYDNAVSAYTILTQEDMKDIRYSTNADYRKRADESQKWIKGEIKKCDISRARINKALSLVELEEADRRKMNTKTR